MRREGVYIYYHLADERVFTLWQTMRQVGEARIAEIDRIVDTYLHDRNVLQPIGAAELLQRLVPPGIDPLPHKMLPLGLKQIVGERASLL